jgi:hypothetical protein
MGTKIYVKQRPLIQESDLVDGGIRKLERQLGRLDVEREDDEVGRLDQVRSLRDDAVPRANEYL